MEAKYQTKIKKYFEAHGWTVIKIMRATVNGYPDLMVLKPDRPPIFIEVKDTGGKLSKVQEYQIKTLRAKGFQVLVAYPYDFDAIKCLA
jgi:Holliday junction resolvase